MFVKKQKLKEFIPSRLTLHQLLKELLWTEGKLFQIERCNYRKEYRKRESLNT